MLGPALITGLVNGLLAVAWMSQVDIEDIYKLLTTQVPAGAPQPSVACMVTRCTKQTFSCLTDRMCLKALACLAPCGNDQACTFHCLSNYETPLLHEFNKCTMHENSCIELQASDTEDKCQERKAVRKLNLSQLSGQWFIVMGHNAIYDCFPCQIFYFDVDDEGRNFVYMDYQVDTVYGETLNKTVLEFVYQLDSSQPGILHLNGTQNGMYHEEAWRILHLDAHMGSHLDSQFDSHLDSHLDSQLMVASYCGSMTNWIYEGAVVFSRNPSMDVEEERRIRGELRRLGYQDDAFCKPKIVGCSIENLRLY